MSACAQGGPRLPFGRRPGERERYPELAFCCQWRGGGLLRAVLRAVSWIILLEPAVVLALLLNLAAQGLDARVISAGVRVDLLRNQGYFGQQIVHGV